LWDTQRKLPAVFLYGNVVISPNEFLSRKLASGVKTLEKKTLDYDAVRRDHLAKLDASIATCVLLG
jgi:hypothetical protein